MRVQKATGCETCGRKKGQRHVAITERPSIAKMERWMNNSGAEATDGCWVEQDGFCPHGHASWVLRLGLI